MLVAGDDHATRGRGARERSAITRRGAGVLGRRARREAWRARSRRKTQRYERAREESDAFASYETHMRVGRRDDARSRARRARSARPRQAGEYRRLLDQLDTALLTAGKVELRRRGKPLIVACAAPKIVLGRDALCDLDAARRRRVAPARRDRAHRPTRFELRDLDSRNGTSLAGLPLVGKRAARRRRPVRARRRVHARLRGARRRSLDRCASRTGSIAASR